MKISQWAKEDRPREKLIKQGVSRLTNSELLAVLIGAGSNQQNVLELSRSILNSINNDLNRLAQLEYRQLAKFKGIGPARALRLLSAMELSRRRAAHSGQQKIKIKGPQDVYKTMYDVLYDQKVECFWVLYLNRGHQVMHRQLISQGGVSGTLVDPKLVFKFALDHLASAIVLVHNHPSGQKTPSKADELLTTKLQQAGTVLEIPVLDHLIFTNSGYFSFADESLLL